MASLVQPRRARSLQRNRQARPLPGRLPGPAAAQPLQRVGGSPAQLHLGNLIHALHSKGGHAVGDGLHRAAHAGRLAQHRLEAERHNGEDELRGGAEGARAGSGGSECGGVGGASWRQAVGLATCSSGSAATAAAAEAGSQERQRTILRAMREQTIQGRLSVILPLSLAPTTAGQDESQGV